MANAGIPLPTMVDDTMVDDKVFPSLVFPLRFTDGNTTHSFVAWLIERTLDHLGLFGLAPDHNLNG